LLTPSRAVLFLSQNVLRSGCGLRPRCYNCGRATTVRPHCFNSLGCEVLLCRFVRVRAGLGRCLQLWQQVPSVDSQQAAIDSVMFPICRGVWTCKRCYMNRVFVHVFGLGGRVRRPSPANILLKFESVFRGGWSSAPFKVEAVPRRSGRAL